MNATRRAAVAAMFAVPLALSACSGSDDAETVTKTVTAPPATTEADAPVPEEVTRVLDALDELDADHTEPVEDEPGELSGAERMFELDIVGYDAGINMFANADDLDVWQEASDDFGGVSVTFDTTAVSLNSDEGKDASLALAPQLAEKLGGEAHTGGEEPDMSPAAESADPYVVECLDGIPGPAMMSDGSLGQSEQCWLDNGGPEYVKAEDEATRNALERQAEIDAYNAEVDAHDERVRAYDAAWVECLGDSNRPDYYEREAYCRDTIPEP